MVERGFDDARAALAQSGLGEGYRCDRHHQSARNQRDLGSRHRQAIHNAIVWQDRRTAEVCATLRATGHEATVTARTGLLLDPYFSATKIAWLLDNVEGARAKAEAGNSPSAPSTRF